MFWDDTPFTARAGFMKANVRDLSPELQKEFDADLQPGFENFRALLMEVYGTPETFIGENELARFHLLSYATQLFFSAVALSGSLVENEDTLYVPKADFKRIYKKPGSTPFEILPNFGVAFTYTKKEQPVASYAACDAFFVRFPQRKGVGRVLKKMSAAFPGVDHKKEYAEALVMLGKADYDRLVLGKSALRQDIDPLRTDILRSTGAAGVLYQDIIRQACAWGFTTQAYLQRYANPAWNINFYQGKKLRLKTMWCLCHNFIYLPVPFEQAETVILNRRSYPERVREAIERFGCVQCGRCKDGKAVKYKKIDNLTVCTGHGESSTIIMELQTAAEVQSLFEIMQNWIVPV